MKLLDLYCCGGGAAMGYHRAGFTEIVGVDIVAQPRYPFTFIQADALTFDTGCSCGHSADAHLTENASFGDNKIFRKTCTLCSCCDWDGFDAIHASPPCQVHSKTKYLAGHQHEDLVSQTRERLKAAGVPYVIENVPGAPLINPIALNGFMFGLPLDRERWFESNIELPFVLLPPAHKRPVKMGRPTVDGDIIQVVGHFSNVPYAQKAMDIDWLGQKELAQAIPPPYTEWIGKQLLAHLST